MIEHLHLGKTRYERAKALWKMIDSGAIPFGGNRKLKIYGQLYCQAGKRMKPENRVFFRNEAEAVAMGYRPCAVCMREKYQLWKKTKQAMIAAQV